MYNKQNHVKLGKIVIIVPLSVSSKFKENLLDVAMNMHIKFATILYKILGIFRRYNNENVTKITVTALPSNGVITNWRRTMNQTQKKFSLIPWIILYLFRWSNNESCSKFCIKASAYRGIFLNCSRSWWCSKKRTQSIWFNFMYNFIKFLNDTKRTYEHGWADDIKYKCGFWYLWSQNYVNPSKNKSKEKKNLNYRTFLFGMKKIIKNNLKDTSRTSENYDDLCT